MRRLLRRFGAERGLALPMALVVMSVSGALVVSVVEFTTSSGRTANVAKGRSSADAFAEAGIANALAVLNYSGNNPSTATLLGCNGAGTVCTPIVSTYTATGGTGGTATWSGWLDSSGGTSTWRITSIGAVPNPSGGPALKKTLTARVPLPTTTGTPNASVWNYVYSTRAPGAGCEVDVNGTNVIIDTPLYITGDLCLSGTNVAVDEQGEGGSPAPQPIDVRVGGKLVLSGTHATIGLASDYITSAAVNGGCTTTINGATQTCARPPFNWYVTTVGTYATVTAPTADFAAWFAANDTINSTSTVAGQDGDCDVRSGSPPVINPDTLLDADAGTITLTTGSAYTCKKTIDGTVGGAVVSELSWDGLSILTIKGAIVVDGYGPDERLERHVPGQRQIYANGAFNYSGSNTKMCANATCDFTTWNPNSEMLIMVAAGNVSMSGSNNKWQGGSSATRRRPRFSTERTSRSRARSSAAASGSVRTPCSSRCLRSRSCRSARRSSRTSP